SIRVFTEPKGRLWSVASVDPDAGHKQTVKAQFQITDEEGRLVAEIHGMSFKRADSASVERAVQRNVDDWLYETAWVPLDRSQPSADRTRSLRTRNWLLLADRAGTGQKLAEYLRARGDGTILAFAQNGDVVDSSSGNENLGPISQDGLEQ